MLSIIREFWHCITKCKKQQLTVILYQPSRDEHAKPKRTLVELVLKSKKYHTFVSTNS